MVSSTQKYTMKQSIERNIHELLGLENKHFQWLERFSGKSKKQQERENACLNTVVTKILNKQHNGEHANLYNDSSRLKTTKV